MISPASGLRLLIAAASVILGFYPAASVSASQPQFVGTGPLSCGDWSAIIAAGPGERRETSMVYDPVRNRMLMFGGFRINTGAFNEVWALSLSSMTWSLVTTVGTPPTARASASAVYDPVRDRLIVYGGDEYIDGPPLGDVWSLSLSATPTWSPLATSATPPVARRFSSMIYDPVRDRLVIFGGDNFTQSPRSLNDLWELRLTGLATWAPIEISEGPMGRAGHGAVYDALHDRMIVYGGAAVLFYGDAWALNLAPTPAWQLLATSGVIPSDRAFFTAVYDSERSRMIVFGGYSIVAPNDLDETWVLSLKYDPAWTQLTPNNPPPPRWLNGGAFDPIGEQLVIYGGYASSANADFSDGARLTFAGGNALDIAAESPDRGHVVRDPDQECYVPGEQVTLTVVPETGHRFTGWRGDATGDANPLTLTMNGHMALIARFDPISTPTLLEQFDAIARAGGIELRWRFGDPQRVTSVVMSRSASHAGPWSPLALETRMESGTMHAIDPDVAEGREYWYRLMATLRGGEQAVVGTASVIAGAPISSSRITRIDPNPAQGPIAVEYAIANPGRVHITILDVLGREVKTLVDEAKSAGRYSATWEGRTSAGRLASGMYFVRLIAPDCTHVGRIALAR